MGPMLGDFALASGWIENLMEIPLTMQERNGHHFSMEKYAIVWRFSSIGATDDQAAVGQRRLGSFACPHISL
jgi:hypothetical protein